MELLILFSVIWIALSAYKIHHKPYYRKLHRVHHVENWHDFIISPWALIISCLFIQVLEILVSRKG